MSKAKRILEEYHKSPISIMTSEGTTYSVDLALSSLRGLVMGMGRKHPHSCTGGCPVCTYNSAVEAIANEIFGVDV